MKILTLDVETPDTFFARIKSDLANKGKSRVDHHSFASYDLLLKILDAKRWALLQALCGAGEISIRETARRVGRDVKAVHGDCVALIKAGILERTAKNGVHFPYDAIKVEFMLKAA